MQLAKRSFSFFAQLPNLKTEGHKMRSKTQTIRPFKNILSHPTKFIWTYLDIIMHLILFSQLLRAGHVK